MRMEAARLAGTELVGSAAPRGRRMEVSSETAAVEKAVVAVEAVAEAEAAEEVVALLVAMGVRARVMDVEVPAWAVDAWMVGTEAVPEGLVFVSWVRKVNVR